MFLHFIIAFLVIVSAFFLKVSKFEVMLLMLSIGLVITSEMFNTAIEKTIDVISLERRPELKFIKDVAAAAVLVASVTALIIGVLIFIVPD